MKYDLEVGHQSSGIYSRATKTACFGGFLFSFLTKTLSIDCGDFHFRFGSPWLKKPSRLLLHKLHAQGFRSNNRSRWKNQMPTPSVSCFVYSRFPIQTCVRISCLFLPTRGFHLDEWMRNYHILRRSHQRGYWFQRNLQKLTRRLIFHILQSGYWYSVFN